jgi:hypothetical protein
MAGTYQPTGWFVTNAFRISCGGLSSPSTAIRRPRPARATAATPRGLRPRVAMLGAPRPSPRIGELLEDVRHVRGDGRLEDGVLARDTGGIRAAASRCWEMRVATVLRSCRRDFLQALTPPRLVT